MVVTFFRPGGGGQATGPRFFGNFIGNRAWKFLGRVQNSLQLIFQTLSISQPMRWRVARLQSKNATSIMASDRAASFNQRVVHSDDDDDDNKSSNLDDGTDVEELNSDDDFVLSQRQATAGNKEPKKKSKNKLPNLQYPVELVGTAGYFLVHHATELQNSLIHGTDVTVSPGSVQLESRVSYKDQWGKERWTRLKALQENLKKVKGIIEGAAAAADCGKNSSAAADTVDAANPPGPAAQTTAPTAPANTTTTNPGILVNHAVDPAANLSCSLNTIKTIVEAQQTNVAQLKQQLANKDEELEKMDRSKRKAEHELGQSYQASAMKEDRIKLLRGQLDSKKVELEDLKKKDANDDHKRLMELAPEIAAEFSFIMSHTYLLRSKSLNLPIPNSEVHKLLPEMWRNNPSDYLGQNLNVNGLRLGTSATYVASVNLQPGFDHELRLHFDRELSKITITQRNMSNPSAMDQEVWASLDGSYMCTCNMCRVMNRASWPVQPLLVYDNIQNGQITTMVTSQNQVWRLRCPGFDLRYAILRHKTVDTMITEDMDPDLLAMLSDRINMTDPNFPITGARFMAPNGPRKVIGFQLRRKHSELEDVFFRRGPHLHCFDGFHGSNASTVRNLVSPSGSLGFDP